jgi:hypothetical protein
MPGGSASVDCKDCKKPAVEGQKRCEFCQAKVRECSRRWREKHPDRARAANAAWMRREMELRPDRVRARNKRSRENADPELAKARRRAYRVAHPDRVREQEKRRYWKNPEARRLRARADKYGITVEQVRELLSRQNCDLCGNQFKDKSFRCHIDHDHETNEVRGVLCGRCNTTLGMLEESPILLARMLAYLQNHKPSLREAC